MIAAFVTSPARLLAAGLGLLAFVVLIPTLLVPIPPLTDYPNHLVRIWLLGGAIDHGAVSHIYAEDWHGIAINVGLDLAAKAFGGIVPAMLLGRILIALAVLLPPLGAVLLNRAAFNRVSPWPLLFFFFWGCETMLAGFLSFQIGLGLALIAAAADLAYAMPLMRRTLMRILATCVLIAVHPAAPFFYCVLLAGIGFGAKPLKAGPLRPRLFAAAPGAIVVLLAMMTYIAFAHAVPTTQGHMAMAGGPRSMLKLNDPINALFGVLSPIVSYDYRIDILFAVPLVAWIAWTAYKGRFQAHRGLLIAATLLASVALFMPSIYHGTAWIDRRLPIMAVLAGLSALTLTPATRRWERTLIPLGLCVLVGLRTLWLGANWTAANAMADSVRAAVADLPAGAKMLAFQHYRPSMGLAAPGRHLAVSTETYRHFPLLATMWRQAYVPTLFGQAGMHPLTIRAPYVRIADPSGGLMSSVHALDPDGMPRLLRDNNRYAPLWRSHFDYVLVLNADRPDKYGPFTPPAGLRLEKDAGFARLYRILK